MVELELLAYLVAAAARLSGLQAMPVAELPPIVQLPPAQLEVQACASMSDGCPNLVAMYDHVGKRILLRDDLDLNNSADNSFLVHELVHVLEHRVKRARFQSNCIETLRSERQAYRVQNAYLREQGKLERHGYMLSQMACAPDQPAGAAAIKLEPGPASYDAAAFEAFMLDLGQQIRSRREP